MSSRAAPLQFGILGCGVIGKTHAESLQVLPDAHLAAVADEDRCRAEDFAARYGAQPYTCLDDMLQRHDLDIVNICTPSGSHGQGACRAMRGGCHVMVEKPLDITLDVIDDILRVQAETGVKLGVVFQHRWDAASRRVRSLIDAGRFGNLVLAGVHVPWWRSQSYYNSGAWRGTWALDGGGVLMNQAIHAIDLLQWFLGPVETVFGYTGTLSHSMETEDTAVAVLRFASGALGTIAATTAAYPGVATRIEIFGDRGSAVIENDALVLEHLLGDDECHVPPYGLALQSTPHPTGDAGHAGGTAAGTHALQIADMIAAVRDDRPPLVDGHAARRSVAIILAVYESARTGHEIRISS